ncbi:MAG: glutamine--fructose-6-phosphate transaminase (isomerizing) [Candidatus Pacebacteria bacterium]|nr:glutamine--fructose-6-phosphate transaminase (isomerizing) [Candidatus Paceibacterota bacterium]
MCGIIGYTGTKNVTPILLAGLEALEYRGYDSAGLSIGGVGIVKAVGKVAMLREKVASSVTAEATSGIAHTRWATHGEPSEVNAHPHIDTSGQLHLVHNGIIENYRDIKTELTGQGYTFYSATDTEVLAKLIGSLYAGNLEQAVTKALARVRGAYGLVVTHEAEPGVIIVARLGSPIVIGVAADGHYVASDAVALLPYTNRLVYLDDGEVAILTPSTYQVKSAGGTERQVTPETAAADIEVIKKDGYRHYMEKEINEAAEVIRSTIRGRVLVDEGKVKLGGLESVLPELRDIQRLAIVGCGSASFAGKVGQWMLETYAGLPTDVEIGSEYRYRAMLGGAGTAVLAVTQSGETADTLASVKRAKAEGLLTLGIVNVVGSSIARETSAGVYNHAGPEVAVASTKAFLSQLTVFALLTVLLGRERGTMTEVEAKEILTALEALPVVLDVVLKRQADIEAIAGRYKDATSMMYIGRGSHAPLAYEGALKMKEVTYIHAEGYPAGELKHGSIALLDAQVPVVALLPTQDVYEKMVSNIEEVKARKAPMIIIAEDGDKHASALADDVIFVPKTHPILQPILSTIPLQLLSYYVGIEKGLDVDKPRNLAKSVTVE